MRPIQRAGYLWVVLGLFLLLGDALYQARLLTRLRDEQGIWAHGVDAGQAIVRGQKYTRYSLFHEYDFEVVYNDQALKVYHQPLRFSALQGQLPEELAPAVKYDPEDPTRFAVSWGVAQASERTAAIALFGSFWALVAALLFLLGYLKLRALEHIQRALQEHALLTFVVCKTTPAKKSTSYIYEVTPADKTTRGVIFDAGEPGPLLLDSGKKIAAIAHQKNPAWHVVLREDLYPLEVDEAQRRALLEQILLKEEGGGAV